MLRILKAHHASLSLNTRLLLNCLDGVSEQDAVQRVADAGNNMGFIAAHLIDARHYMARLLGSEIENPVGGLLAEVSSIDEVRELPSLDALRVAWRAVSRHVLTCVSTAPEHVILGNSEHELPIEDATLLGGLAFLLHHESYHIGQMGVLRRQLGYTAMSYALDATGGGEGAGD